MPGTVDPSRDLDEPPWSRIESTLMSTSRAIRRAYDARLSPIGLNQSDAMLLLLLEEEGPRSQTELATRLGMRRAAAGQMIDRLAKKGLLERKATPVDRRVWLVTPTEEARPLIARIREIDIELRAALRAGISKAERRELMGVLERIRENITKVATEPRLSSLESLSVADTVDQ